MVVAIIAILSSLLLTAVSTAKRKAQRVVCMTVIRSYAMKISDRGRFVVVIPQEANCHQCHFPRYNAGLFLDTINP